MNVNLNAANYSRISSFSSFDSKNESSRKCTLLKTCLSRGVLEQQSIPISSSQIPLQRQTNSPFSTYTDAEIRALQQNNTPNRFDHEDALKLIKRNEIRLCCHIQSVSSAFHRVQADVKFCEEAVTYTVSKNGWLEIWDTEKSTILHQFFICPFSTIFFNNRQIVKTIVDVQEIGPYLCVYGEGNKMSLTHFTGKTAFIIDLREILKTGKYSADPLKLDVENNEMSNRYIAGDKLFLFKNDCARSAVYAFKLDPESKNLKRIWQYENLGRSHYSTHRSTDDERLDYFHSSNTIVSGYDNTNHLIRSNDKYLLLPIKYIRECKVSAYLRRASYYHTTRFLTLLNIESGKEEMVHLLESTRNFPQYLQLNDNIVIYQKDAKFTSGLLKNILFVHPNREASYSGSGQEDRFENNRGLDGEEYKLHIRGNTQKVTLDFNREKLVLKIIFTSWEEAQKESEMQELTLSSDHVITSKMTIAKNFILSGLDSMMKGIALVVLSNIERYDSNRRDDKKPDEL